MLSTWRFLADRSFFRSKGKGVVVLIKRWFWQTFLLGLVQLICCRKDTEVQKHMKQRGSRWGANCQRLLSFVLEWTYHKLWPMFPENNLKTGEVYWYIPYFEMTMFLFFFGFPTYLTIKSHGMWHMGSVQNPCWLMIIGDHITLYILGILKICIIQ